MKTVETKLKEERKALEAIMKTAGKRLLGRGSGNY